MMHKKKKMTVRFSFKLMCLFALTNQIFAQNSQVPENKDSHSTHSNFRLTNQEDRPGYTINFTNVSIQEYLKFISKIADLNFVYEPNELNFNVTILSEEPTDLTNILAALAQELRIHGFSMLDDGVNLVIHKTSGVNQIATVVSDDLPYVGQEPPLLVTRLFRIHNANLNSLARIIKPMLSTQALVEVSDETRHLIVTDTSASIDKIADILMTLDAPRSPLEVDAYTVKNNTAENLASLANQIIMPLSEGNPVIIVPQTETKTIFVVSTPFLIEKTINILEDLDGKPITHIQEKVLSGENIFFYKVRNKSPQSIEKALENIGTSLEEQGYAPEGLLESIESARYINETNSFVFTGTPEALAKIKELLNEIDILTKPIPQSENSSFFIYKPKFKPALEVADIIRKIGENFISSGLADRHLINSIENLRVEEATNSLIFTGDTQSLDEIKELLNSIDVPTQSEINAKNARFYVYKIKYAQEEQIAQSLNTLADNLEDSPYPDKPLIEAIDSMKWIRETNSLIFSGSSEALNKLIDILPTFDVPPEHSKAVITSNEFLLYTPKFINKDQLLESIKTLANNLRQSGLANPALINSLETAKWVESSQSIVFTGDQVSLDRIRELLDGLDLRTEQQKPGIKSNEFLMYTPKFIGKNQLIENIQALTDNLKESGLANPALINSLETAKWVESSHAIVFTGDPETLARIKELLTSIDIREGAAPQALTTFIYKANYVSVDVLKRMLDNLAANLPESDEEKSVLENMQIAEDTNSLIFKGSERTLENIRNFLVSIDTPNQADTVAATKTSYFIYKLRYASGSQIIQDLDNLAKKLQASNLPGNESLIRSIQSVEWIKASNSLYITGTPENLDKIKDLIDRFDQEKIERLASSYFIYKPEYMSAQEAQDQLFSIAEGLQASGLADPDLINTITTAKYVPANNSLVFSGTPKSIQSIKELLETIEQQAPAPRTPIQTFGKKTFFVYKLKHVPGQQLLMNLKNIASDLQYGNTDDKDLINAINSGRFIPETNSIIFTGTIDALERVQQLIEKFDTQTLAPKQYTRQPEGYLVYRPEHVPPQQLISILQEFKQHLLQVGVDEPDLFETINTLKYLDKTSSIIITGTSESTQKVEELLKRFDVPSQYGSEEPSIETIDELSFLIYKLKYHQGSEIEDALKKIAVDLSRSKASEKNQSLVEAIDSLQWIQVTNSLIGTGTPQSLSKLKTLIGNIDTPLQQIFIELLVIETDLDSALDFGLRWGTQGQYRNKLGYSTGAFPKYGESTRGTSSDPLSGFTDSLQAISATNTPTGGTFTQGFNLGVIGDIIYHKGQSYTALGSLLDAVRQDGSSTVVLSQKVITQNNKPTSLFSGDNIPFTGSTVQNAGSNATVFTSNLEYKDIGVTLNLTPRVGDEGLITLNIDQEITEQLSSNPATGSAGQAQAYGGNITTPSVNGISTSKTSMQTQATVPDQHFLVLSGIVRNTKTKQRSSIPCLGGLPIIGAAFQFTETQIQKRSVIIFVKPQIIQDFKQYKEITEDAEDLGKKQGIPEDYDEGLEIVKSPNDA